MSIVIDLDADSGLLIKGTFIQDFRAVHSTCWVIFKSFERLDLSQGNVFVFRKQQWEAASYRRVEKAPGSYVYSVLGYPWEISTKITELHRSFSELARGLKIPLFHSSIDYKFETPIRNVTLGALLYKYRFQSLEQNSDIGNAFFLYYDDRGLVGQSYKDMARAGGTVFPHEEGSNSMRYSLVVDHMRSEYRFDPYPSRYRYKGLMDMLIGAKVEATGILSLTLGNRYLLKTGEDDIDKLSKMVLVRQKFDSTRSQDPWTLTFGHLEV